VERVVNDRYRVQVIGTVSAKPQNQDFQEIEMRKLRFVFAEKSTDQRSIKKPRKTFAEACRLRFLDPNGVEATEQAGA